MSNKVIGAMLLSIPVGVLFYLMACDIGIKATVVIFAVAALATALYVIGINLLTGGE